MPVVAYANPGEQLYIMLDNTNSSVFNMSVGKGRKSCRYYVPDTTIAKAGVPRGVYTGIVCKGTSATTTPNDERIGSFTLMWDGQRETNWNEVVIKANAAKTPLLVTDYQKMVSEWGL